MLFRLIAPLAVLLAFRAPTVTATENPVLHAQSQLQRSIDRSGPVQGFLRHVAPDIAYLHPGQEIITGRQATAAFLRSIHSPGTPVTTILHVIAGDVSADRRLGYTFGWLEESSASSGGPTTFGKFIATWKKREDGWRVQGFLRLDSGGPPSPVPDDALIVDGEPGVRKPGLPAAHRLDIAIADSRFADLSIAQGYTIAFPAYAADAAVLVAFGDFFWNRAGVEAAFAGWDPTQTLSWYPLRAEAAESGDLGWSIGHGTFKIDDGSNVQRFFSKYLTVWLRTAAGWRWLLDAGNPRPAP